MSQKPLKSGVTGLLVAVVLSTGATAVAGKASSGTTKNMPASWGGTRMVFTQSCLNKKPETEALLPFLLSSIVSPLAKKGVDAIGNAMKKAGEDKTAVSYATIPIEIETGPTGKQELKDCLIYVKGSFYHSNPEKGQGSYSDSKSGQDAFEKFEKMRANLNKGHADAGIDNIWSKLADQKIYLAAEPAVILEVQLVPNDKADLKYLRFEPTYLAYSKSGNKRSNTAKIVAQVMFHNVGDDISLDDGMGSPLVVGNFKPGEGPWLFGDGSPASPWFLPPKSGEKGGESPSIGAATNALSKGSNALKAERASLQASLDKSLATIKTEQDNLASLADQLAAAAADKKRAIEDKIDASNRNLDGAKKSRDKLDAEIKTLDPAIAAMDDLTEKFEDVADNKALVLQSVKEASKAFNLAERKLKAPSATFTKTAEDVRSALAKVGQVVNQPSHYYNATLKFAETQAGSKFMKALSGVFEESKEDIKAKIDLALSKEKRDEAAMEKYKAQLDANAAYYTAYAGYDALVKTYCETTGGPATTVASATLRKAQENLNYLAMVAELDTPVSALVPISSDKPDASSGVCATTQD